MLHDASAARNGLATHAALLRERERENAGDFAKQPGRAAADHTRRAV